MSTDDFRIINPHTGNEQKYPYHPVWQSIIRENAVLLTLTGILFLVGGRIFPVGLYQPIGVSLALLPLGLWLLFSRWRENFAPEPRERLVAVLIISALTANAIGIPFTEHVMQVDRWLPLAPAINRIIGYTLAVGIVQEGLKYLVVRYVVWPRYFRIRLDGVAYGAASAVGYAFVVNLHFVTNTIASPDVVALRIFSTHAFHLAASIIVGYGLAQTKLGRVIPLILPISLLAASLLTGVAIPLRAGFVNASLSVNGSGTRPFFGLMLSITLLVLPLVLVAFLIRITDSHEERTRIDDR